MEKVITDEKFKLLVEKLCEEFDVYAPCVSGNYSEFTQIKHFNECDFNILNTTRPLKHLFLPQTEKLFTVMGEGDNLKLETCPPLKKKRIILGAKSCEVKGVELLSNIYSIGACKDELFIDKKDNTLIIGLTCVLPQDTCFCTALGINPAEEKGMDIVFAKINDKYSMKSITKQGDDFLRKYNDMFDNPTEMDEILKKKILESITMNKKTLLDFKKIKPYLDKGFESSLWKDMSKRCITCGICTYLCPTCQCFDIHDETGKDWGPVRFRTWDTCMSPDFTRMAGGHNPREKKVSRIRQRFMHKFKYYFDYFSIPDCTGCGRCIQFCPVNIDVFELLQKLEKQGDKIQ